MRLLLATFLLLLGFVSFTSLAYAKDDQNIERANAATAIFTKACFINYGKKERAVEFMNAEFHKHDDLERRQMFLDFTKTKKGDVWIALEADGVFAIVLSDKGNCHVIAQQAARDRVHTNIAALADKAGKNLKLPLNKHEPSSGSETKSSGFEVVGQGDKRLMVVVVSTPIEQAPNKPDAIITMAVEAY